MKSKIAVLVLSLCAACAVLTPAQTSTAPASRASASFSFTAINFPGANRTRAVGLNDHGDIVGDYLDSAGVRHAYLLHQGNFASFDAPGAIETRSLVVNNLGVIGGTFLDSGGVRKAVFVCFLILIPCSLHAQDKKGDLQAP